MESAVSSDRCGLGSRQQPHREGGTKELEPAELIWALKSGPESKFQPVKVGQGVLPPSPLHALPLQLRQGGQRLSVHLRSSGCGQIVCWSTFKIRAILPFHNPH